MFSRSQMPSRAALALLSILLTSHPARPQMMAHPGWRGNGIANAAWWRDGIFVRVEPGSTLKATEQQLDAIAQAGADAVILPVLSEDGADLTSVKADMGTADDVDTLLREASARRMHVIVGLPYARLKGSPGNGANVVRFWLTHGAAGVDVGPVEPSEAAMLDLRSLRSLVDRFTGQRVLLAGGEAAEGRVDPVTLRLLPADHVIAAGRAKHGDTRGGGAIELGAPPSEAEKELRTVPLLLSGGPVVLSSALLGGSPQAQEWMQQVFALRRTNGALRRGLISPVETAAAGASAWLARPAVPSATQPAVLVLTNASTTAVTLNLQAQVSAMRVRGSFLRALLRNDGGMGSLNLQRITLRPNGVFVGEVRY